MPVETLPGSDERYYLIAFDAEGRERADDPDGLMSERVSALLAAEPYTDVVLLSHGWRGDVPSARQQYGRWIGAMLASTADLERVRQARPDFRPLFVGLHWPSEPWGDEELGGGAFGAAAGPPIDDLVERYAERLGDTPEEREAARPALRTIFDALQIDTTPAGLPDEVLAAYAVLDDVSGLGASGPGAAPGDDRQPFDAQAIYQEALTEPASYGEFTLGSAFLLPLRLLSFWRMKDRGRRVGEGGGHSLLVDLQQAAGEARGVRFHLIGHSFGCIVISAAVAGPDGRGTLARPVDSMVLLQGALSLWSYCDQIPVAAGRHGYFRSIIADGRVAGPIVATTSEYDTAVGVSYPKAAGVAGHVSYGPGERPRYGAVGAWGIQGDGLPVTSQEMLPASGTYGFEAGRIYNLDGSRYIRKGGPPSGAHSDIAGPEVAHAIWEAAWAGELLAFNGVNCSRGTYLLPPRSARYVSALARGEAFEPEHLRDLEYRIRQRDPTYGVVAGVDERDLAQTGWGVIFAHGADPAVREALAPLLEHRRRQSTQKEERYYREFVGEHAYRAGTSKNAFLARHGAAPGPVDPSKMPYYLLLVGDPEAIPYTFQYQLDVQHAVGRIHFDTPDEYARYARSVVAAETDGPALPRRAAFFGVQNRADEPTSLSANHLIKPLATRIAGAHADWTVQTLLRDEATKARLGRLVGGDETPALLFTASHGAVFDPGDERQLRHQGALLCQEWPGPFGWPAGRPVPHDHYLAGDDVGDGASPHGLIAFFFACYGAGTPRYDDYAHRRPGARERAEIAPRAFVAGLPKRLLSHPKGGALAVVGHVERAWGCSFTWGGRTRQHFATFESAAERLLAGFPVGAALEYFNEKYAELSTDLSRELEDISFGRRPDDLALSDLWTANNDARGYAIIGDPAVRLCVGSGTAAPSPLPPPVLISPRSAGGATPPPLSASPLASAASSPPPPPPVVTAPPAAPTAPTAPAGPEPPVVSSAPSSAGEEVTDGLRDDAAGAEAGARLSTGLRQLADRMAQTVGEAATLTVTTYLTDDLAAAADSGGQPTGAAPQVVTRIGPTGGLDLYLPTDPGQVDASLWARHLALVERAMARRTELLKSAIEAARILRAALREVRD